MSTEHILGNAKHRQQVGVGMTRALAELAKRAIEHDDSKYDPDEFDAFAIATPRLATLTFPSAEYQASLDSIKPALDAHYSKNSHHPQFYPDGVSGMDFFDLVEMLCDWRAAGLRHIDGDFDRSMEHNRQRFNISDEVFQMMRRTADKLFPLRTMQVQVEFYHNNAFNKVMYDGSSCDVYFIDRFNNMERVVNIIPHSQEDFELTVQLYFREAVRDFVLRNQDPATCMIRETDKLQQGDESQTFTITYRF